MHHPILTHNPSCSVVNVVNILIRGNCNGITILAMGISELKTANIVIIFTGYCDKRKRFFNYNMGMNYDMKNRVAIDFEYFC